VRDEFFSPLILSAFGTTVHCEATRQFYFSAQYFPVHLSRPAPQITQKRGLGDGTFSANSECPLSVVSNELSKPEATHVARVPIFRGIHSG
jgi:hypothetical protein